MLATMVPEIQKNLENMGAYEMVTHLKEMFQQQARQERFETTKGKGKGKGKRKGKDVVGETKPAPRPNPQPAKKAKPTKESICFSARKLDTGREIASCIWKI